MGQNNTERISHKVEDLPNTFRSDELKEGINDLDEEIMGLGFSEVIRTGAFVSKITVWDRPTNNPTPDPAAIKRSESIFNRTGPFVDSIVKTTYKADGVTPASVVTSTITRDGSNRTVFVDTGNVRP